MTLQGLITRRVTYAALLAVALVLGTLVGGAAYETTNPPFDRIVWNDYEAADAAGDLAVRRALFADGRFLALTSDGYRAGVVEQTLADAIFATVRAGSPSWAPAYEAAGVAGERIELALGGRSTRSVVVANPMMNFALPADLGRVMRLLSAADRSVAAVAFVPSSLLFTAEPVTADANELLEALPVGFPIEAASRPGGVVVGGSELAILKSIWTDLDQRLEPGTAHRLVDVDGQGWRISWRLDLEALGPLTALGAAPR